MVIPAKADPSPGDRVEYNFSRPALFVLQVMVPRLRGDDDRGLNSNKNPVMPAQAGIPFGFFYGII